MLLRELLWVLLRNLLHLHLLSVRMSRRYLWGHGPWHLAAIRIWYVARTRGMMLDVLRMLCVLGRRRVLLHRLRMHLLMLGEALRVALRVSVVGWRCLRQVGITRLVRRHTGLDRTRTTRVLWHRRGRVGTLMLRKLRCVTSEARRAILLRRWARLGLMRLLHRHGGRRALLVHSRGGRRPNWGLRVVLRRGNLTVHAAILGRSVLVIHERRR